MTASLYERSGKPVPPEEDPSLNAPLVAFLASEAAAHVNGQILGRTEYAYTLFQQPKQIAWMWRDGPWTPAEVAAKFDVCLGQHLQHRRGRVARRPAARHLVDLVDHKHGVAHLHAAQRLDDQSGHGAHVRAPVPPDLRLVAHAPH